MIATGIDIGTNTFRLLVAELRSGRLTPLAKELHTVRLGKGLAETGVLAPETMQKGLQVLSSFQMTIARFKPQAGRACGTEALRLAANREEFLAQARQSLGMPIEIISGAEEAGLSLAGALAAQPGPVAGDLLLVDAGGGSTELILKKAANSRPEIVSLPIGAVGLTERFPENHGAGDPSRPAMDTHIRQVITDGIRSLGGIVQSRPPLLVMGSGGTATALAALDLQLPRYDESLVQGHRLAASSLARIYQDLARLPIEERNRLPGLEMGRGEIILAGARIYQVLLELLGTEVLAVSDAGLLEGIVLSRVLPAWK